MFQISVEREFCAAHALRIRGVRETTHGHNFRLTVTLQGDALDQDGLLLDFHALEALLDGILAPLRNADLNQLGPFAAEINPSAEEIARYIGDRVRTELPTLANDGPGNRAIGVHSVRLTEAPGCSVLYVPE